MLLSWRFLTCWKEFCFLYTWHAAPDHHQLFNTHVQWARLAIYLISFPVVNAVLNGLCANVKLHSPLIIYWIVWTRWPQDHLALFPNLKSGVIKASGTTLPVPPLPFPVTAVLSDNHIVTPLWPVFSVRAPVASENIMKQSFVDVWL